MKFKYFAILLLVLSSNSFSQSLDSFKVAFEKALRPDFSSKELNHLFSKYSNLVTPHSDGTRLIASVKGDEIQRFPLSEYKSNPDLKKSVSEILNSDNRYQRLLAYLIVAASGDSSNEQVLVERLRSEESRGNRIWAGMALLYLGANCVTALFDFIIKDEILNDAHMLPLFITLNKDSLREVAYLRIESNDAKSKILAAQVLAFTGRNAKTEKVLKQAVKQWEFGIKGYAVHSLKQLGVGELFETVKPLLDSSKTRMIAIEALSNSPTNEDRQYLIDLIAQQDTATKDLLDGLLKSDRIENVRLWLKLLVQKPMPQRYKFFYFNQPLLTSDELLPDLHVALESVKSSDILHELVRALSGRSDAKSVEIMVSFLRHPDSTVRYWAASALKGCKSSKLVSNLCELIANRELRTVALTELIIENEIDSLQVVYENIYLTEIALDWKRSAIEYLSAFPLERNIEVFRSELLNSKGDTFIKRNAALGLGRLKDSKSVDLIIEVSRKERENSDYNVQAFLVALGMIKGETAKKEIERYAKSDESTVKNLASEILSEWEH